MLENKKRLRYEVCLTFISKVFKDFKIQVSEELDSELIFIGNVAFWIDTSLDQLDPSQKENLYWKFPGLYRELITKVDVVSFKIHCEEFMRSNGIVLDQNPNFKLLFSLVQTCKDLRIEKALDLFAMQTIHASLMKLEAHNAKQISTTLEREGAVAVDFLLLYLEKKGMLKGVKDQDSLKNYLINLEHLLNLADDLIDSQKDARNNSINVQPRFAFYLHFVRKIIAQLFTTWIKNPYLLLKHVIQFTSRAVTLEIRMLR